ncbi:hypothetical protein F444_18825 [Phytophthora nicotianae P1976]|uniref:Uncharacterized protein n=1 Tax=Phytophthora nicotianae P1976 TaxID=1317066 RepID=A0A080ZA21_PHYNI|nr:hypothetical protein F444_18825 [Phytophthora nicotianae P1976]
MFGYGSLSHPNDAANGTQTITGKRDTRSPPFRSSLFAQSRPFRKSTKWRKHLRLQQGDYGLVENTAVTPDAAAAAGSKPAAGGVGEEAMSASDQAGEYAWLQAQKPRKGDLKVFLRQVNGMSGTWFHGQADHGVSAKERYAKRRAQHGNEDERNEKRGFHDIRTHTSEVRLQGYEQPREEEQEDQENKKIAKGKSTAVPATPAKSVGARYESSSPDGTAARFAAVSELSTPVPEPGAVTPETATLSSGLSGATKLLSRNLAAELDDVAAAKRVFDRVQALMKNDGWMQLFKPIPKRQAD